MPSRDCSLLRSNKIDAIGGEDRVHGLAFLEPDLARQQDVEPAARRHLGPHQRRMAERLDRIDGAGDR